MTGANKIGSSYLKTQTSVIDGGKNMNRISAMSLQIKGRKKGENMGIFQQIKFKKVLEISHLRLEPLG